MPKATLVFILPEESTEYHTTIFAQSWKNIVYDVAIFLRDKLKHGHEFKTADDALEAVKQELWNSCNDYNLDPFEE